MVYATLISSGLNRWSTRDVLFQVWDRFYEYKIEVINETDTQDELVDDFVSLITSMAARIYGRRSSRQRSERIRACVEQVYQVEG